MYSAWYPLVDHVQASIKLIETAKLEETATEKEYGDVFLLDDVTPIYVQAGAALETCSVSLSTAVQFLLEIDTATAGA